MKKIIRFSVMALAGLCLSACATTPEDRTPVGRDGERVSTIPWNRPQGWEGTGALGPMADQFGGRR